jgi:RNA polymerase subunit RPABC4/transcription elongation factor Spt4
MIKQAPSITRSLHWPLSRLALCLDCDECFQLGSNSCPACGSETWTTLARFLEIISPERVTASAIRDATRFASREREEGPIAQHLLIVARERVRLYEHLRQTFAGDRSVQVLLDRRRRERRQGQSQSTIERRQGERRARPSIDERSRAIRWSLVLLDLVENERQLSR